MSFDDICYLKKIESVLDIYYNSGDYKYTMDYIFKNFDSPFYAFELMVKYYEENGLFKLGLSHDAHCDALKCALEGFGDEAADCVGFDRMLNRKCKLKSVSTQDESFRKQCFDFLMNRDNLNMYLKEYADVPAKKIIKFVIFERFFDKVWIYNLKSGELRDITSDFGD